MELIKIQTLENGQRAVLVSDLYDFLEVKTKYNDWIKRNVLRWYDDGIDYYETAPVRYSNLSSDKTKGGQNKKEYVLTLDCAKSIAMAQMNEKGKIIRKYFIEVEKLFFAIATPQQIADLYNRLTKLEAQTIDYKNDWSVDRYLRVNDLYKSLTISDRQQLGKQCTKAYKTQTGNQPKKVSHPSYINGQNVYPYELINNAFKSWTKQP